MKRFLLILLIIICFGKIAICQSEIWNDIQESQITQIGERLIIPDTYRVLEFDLPALNSLFENAPNEFTNEAEQNPSIVSLPMPDGKIERFSFWVSPTMAPELQLQFPEITTYTGQGIDDKAASLKMDLTPQGFHAMILSPEGRVFIDPYARGNIKYYISYYTKDFTKNGATLDCELFIEDGKLEELKSLRDIAFLTPTGPQLRTYRFALLQRENTLPIMAEQLLLVSLRLVQLLTE